MSRSFSAAVRLELRIGQQKFDVAETGPMHFTLRKPLGVNQEPTAAEILMVVDGDGFLWPVGLPRVSSDQELVTLVSRGEMQRLGKIE